MRSLVVLALGASSLVLPLAARAQLPRPEPVLGRYYGPPVAARQATPQEAGRVAMPSPMLLDVSLQAYGYNKSLQGWDFSRFPWSLGETSAFTCEGARIDWVEVRLERSTLQGKVEVQVSPTLAPELPGRTVDLTVAFVVDGAEVKSQSARLSTRGVVSAGRVVAPPNSGAAFDFEFAAEEFDAMFAAGRSPVLRLILAV